MQNDSKQLTRRMALEETAFLGICAKLTGVFLEIPVEKVRGV